MSHTYKVTLDCKCPSFLMLRKYECTIPMDQIEVEKISQSRILQEQIKNIMIERAKRETSCTCSCLSTQFSLSEKK